ncbi:DNA double-strand break repair rad50 ATPase-like [Invertebrate iridovirus 25]|uniref:DNA double-strand break repair rad50 ATPase-like n=1 Tax=Invertebrate iridovirus 25 TaxID=1301280 RepID=W8W2G9_9VIRU|nr:DNA double-strand break repair rad50 ATPase-like [Invertebrate iridovirus 25]CCV02185.1 DNA double-strand break repair rad50 ATPase-like [Invertebrate iridovirus 25]
MKLTLKNFRCYTSQTFEFEDDNITLISGASGRGKTSLLLAIQFALYGSSTHKYLVSHNSTSCEVTLIYKNFKVKRTKRPNILNVEVDGKFYEDKEAQIILNKYFGVINSSNFFMDLSHLEKMEFLEKIVNANCDVKDLKNKIKIELNCLVKQMAVLDGQILNANNMLEIVQKPTKVEKPIISKFFEDGIILSKEELFLKKEKTTSQLKLNENLNQLHSKLMYEQHHLQNEIDEVGNERVDESKEIQKLKSEIESLIQQKIHFEMCKNKMIMVKETLKELKKYEKYTSNDLEELNHQLKSLNVLIEKCLKYSKIREINKLKNEYITTLKLEQDEHFNTQSIVELQLKDLQLKESKINDLNQFEQINQKFNDYLNFNSKHNLNEIKERVADLKLKFFKNYNCKRCNHPFAINMDTFEMSEWTENMGGTTHHPPKDIKIKLCNLENLIVAIEEGDKFIKKTDINKVQETIKKIKKYKSLIVLVKPFTSSISLVKMKEKLDSEVCSNLDEPDLKDLETLDLEDLKDKKRDLTIKINKISDKLTCKNNLLKKIKIKEEDSNYNEEEHFKLINSIENKNALIQSKIINQEKFKKMEKLRSKLSQINIEIKNLNFVDMSSHLHHTLHFIDLGLEYHTHNHHYSMFQSQLKKYKKVKETLNELVENKKKLEQTYLKMCIFKQKVIESEHESLEGIINTINTHLSILLQDFFSESFGDPIQIYLELISEKRPQVNIVIHYKGNITDYKSLSTGEAARVKLAFDLTFKEILGEQIIMLDECTANLDQDLSTKIFNTVKSAFPSKCVLIIAHQVVMGTFDHVLNLN